MANLERIVWNGWFSLDVPSDWNYGEDDGVIVVCDEDKGVGAIQISCVRRSRKSRPALAETVELAETFAKERGWNLEKRKISSYLIDNTPTSEFVFVEADDEPTFWHVWHIIEEKRAAFITYNCAAEDAEKELMVRKEIIKSFKWEPLEH